MIQQQAIGSSSAAQLSYAYDLADRVTQVTYPSGRIVHYGYDGKGRVNLVETKASAGVGTWTVLASGQTYEPFGPVKAMALGNGLSVANDWGDDGRLASRRLYRTSGGTDLSWLSYGYDADDNITAIRDQLNDSNSLYYGYDANGRLKLTSLVAGSPAAASESYAYATGTNRLSSVTNASGTRAISYDGRGNTASESRPGSVSAATGYDGYGRLTAYSRTDIGSLSFVYNGQDDRVAMTSGTGTRRFVYDPGGRVLGEYGASTSDVHAEYIWAGPEVANDNEFGGDDGVGGYAPLVLATPDSGGTIVLNWVHGNHLGVPIVTTDASGNAATTPNDYLAPGFPGQSRVLADLYYNRYRDYDPSTGRYIQADPIGLAGGANSYVYAENNPITWIDPWGLKGFNPGGNGCIYDDDGNLLFCDKPLEPVYWEAWLPIGKFLKACYTAYKFGHEYPRYGKFRFAPFGNRTGHKYGRWPHYHRPDSKGLDGNPLAGQSGRRHRPFEPNPHDKKWTDRF